MLSARAALDLDVARGHVASACFARSRWPSDRGLPSNAQHEQRHRADAGQKGDQCYRVVLEPVPAAHAHDATPVERNARAVLAASPALTLPPFSNVARSSG